MAKKPQKKPHKDPRDKILEAALSLAAAKPWAEITMAAIAKKAKISLAALASHFDDKSDIIVYFGRMVDRKTLERVPSEPNLDTPVKERLFDILMERFDILNESRASLVSILESFKSDPKQIVIIFPHVCRSMNWMLEACGADTSGLCGAVKVAGLSVVYLKALKAWKEDDNADLAKTMAALDKALEQAERVGRFAGL